MAGSLTSTSQIYKKPWQAREESTENTFIDASDGGGAVIYVDKYGALPTVTKASIKINENYKDIAQVGQEDLVAIKRGKKGVEFSLTMLPSDTYKTFLKYLTNAANYTAPSGTPAKSLSIFFSKYIDNGSGALTEYYYKFQGCRVKTSTFSLKEDGPWEIAADFIANDLTITTSGLATATPVTAFPSEESWDFDDGGAGHGTWNSNTVYIKEFSVTFDRKTTANYVTGARTSYSSKTHGRRIAGTIKILNLGTANMYTDMEGDTARTLAIVMKSSTGYTMTLTNVKATDLGEEHDGDDTEPTTNTFGFTAKGFTDF